MKKFKKITATLLACAMSLSFVACGDDPTSSTPPPATNNQQPIATGDGAKYAKGIVDSILAANTITVDVDFAVETKNLDKLSTRLDSSEAFDVNGNITVTIAKTETAYDLMVDGTINEREGEYKYDDPSQQTGAWKYDEVETDKIGLRIIGNDVYTWEIDYNWNASTETVEKTSYWAKDVIDWDDMDMPEGVSSMLGDLYASLKEGDMTEVYNFVGMILEQTLTIDPATQEFKFDMDVKADYIDPAFKFLKEFNYDQTLAAYIDSLLKKAGAKDGEGNDLTVATILATINAQADTTLGEVVTALDTALQAETGKSIDEAKVELLTQLDISMLQEYLTPEMYTKISGMITTIKDTPVQTLLENYKVADLTLDDLLAMISADEEGEPEEEMPPMTVESITTMVGMALNNMKFSDLLDMAFASPNTQVDGVAELMKILDAFQVTTLSQGVGIKFNGYGISKVSYTYDIDFTLDYTSVYMYTKQDVDFSITLSNATTTIAVPEGEIVDKTTNAQ